NIGALKEGSVMLRIAVALLAALAAGAVAAQDKVTFLTSWYAQAEHGGFYQALATGLYKKQGLDVTIRMGGPQVNGMQLMMAGQADMHMGYVFQVHVGLAGHHQLHAVHLRAAHAD